MRGVIFSVKEVKERNFVLWGDWEIFFTGLGLDLVMKGWLGMKGRWERELMLVRIYRCDDYGYV